MEVVNFLNLNGIEGLSNIKVAEAKNMDGVYILNYMQIPADKNGMTKYDPILCNCRNLVVRKRDSKWEMVSRSFRRFFNWGEDVEETKYMEKQMALGNVTAYEKFDGSLITVTFDKVTQKWCIFTRGSNADENPYNTIVLAQETTFGNKVRELIDLNDLDTEITYIFELCIPGAGVTIYSEPFLALLSANKDGVEIDVIEDMVKDWKIKPRFPEVFKCNNIKDVLNRIATKSNDFEGYVLCCKDGDDIRRVKVKSATYVAMHHTVTQDYTTKDLIKIVLTNETDEVISVLERNPKYTFVISEINEIKRKMIMLYENIESKYETVKHLEGKEFALAVKDHPYKSVLFTLSKSNKTVKECIEDMNLDIVVKYIKNF
jgi:hypothetical protein